MVSSWSVVAHPQLWLVFPCQYFAICIHKIHEHITIYPVTAQDVQLTPEAFSKLSPRVVAQQYVVRLQERWLHAESTQVHIMHHYRFLMNLVVKFKSNRDKVLLRRILLCVQNPELELVD
jgi:hypothetical protein